MTYYILQLEFDLIFFILPEYICYDDGCHLWKYAQNEIRRDVSRTSKKLASIQIVVDKLHMAGHVDKWCIANCDPHLFHDLDNVSVLKK